MEMGLSVSPLDFSALATSRAFVPAKVNRTAAGVRQSSQQHDVVVSLFALFFLTQMTTTMATVEESSSTTSMQGDDGDRPRYQDEEDQEQLQPQKQDPQPLPSPDNYSPSHHYGQIDQDEEEVQSLVSSTVLAGGGGGRLGRHLTFDDELDDEFYDDHEAGCCKGFRCLTIAMILVLTAATLALLLPIEAPRLAAFRRWRRHHQLPIEFDCPARVDKAANFVGDENDGKDYDQMYEQITDNITQYLHHFRNENYDDWSHSYEYVKNHSRPFKAKYFSPNLKNNDMIFESACGVGLNLYMTLEILQEFGIENLVVYGNEYLELGTTKATVLFEQAPPAESELGIICPGDSTHLDFVPSNAFDLAYTGYISPIEDPLNFDMAEHEKFDRYREICEDDLWQSVKLRDMAQKVQNDWYGAWVSELVRIAKPGVPVIVEQVSQPFCTDVGDWGGVSSDWWAAAIDTYHWDIDPQSIEFMNDTIFQNRYHVFMRKNGKVVTVPGE